MDWHRSIVFFAKTRRRRWRHLWSEIRTVSSATDRVFLFSFASGENPKGSDTRGRTLGRYCGTTTPPPIVSKGRLFLQFKTDDSTTGAGFRISYTTMQCGGLINRWNRSVGSGSLFCCVFFLFCGFPLLDTVSFQFYLFSLAPFPSPSFLLWSTFPSFSGSQWIF